MSGFSSAGFTKKTLEECRAEIVAEVLARVSASLDCSVLTPEGQIIAIAAEREAALQELVETLAHAIDPNAAEDWLLDAVCAITGTTREPAKKSKVTITANVDDGASFTAGQIMINVDGLDTTRFVNKKDEGPFTPAGTYPIDFECTDYGPIAANSGTLTVITAPVSGLNTVTNALDATLGALREDDTSLRVKRTAELTAAGACTVDSLRADILEVEGVQQAFVFENVTLITNGDGMPGKSIEVVFFDGASPEADDQTIADTIWKGKPSGSETYGTTNHAVLDATGAPQAVNYTRAAVKNVWFDFVDVEVDAEFFPSNGAALVKAAVAAYAAKKLNLGVDVIALGMKAAAMTVPGVIDVPTLHLGFASSPTLSANLPITGRQIASCDTSRMTVTTTPGTP